MLQDAFRTREKERQLQKGCFAASLPLFTSCSGPLNNVSWVAVLVYAVGDELIYQSK